MEISAKLERECDRSSGLQVEIDKLKAELAEARLTTHNAESAAQAFYDQGFKETTKSLRFQLHRECNIYFLKGWVLALEQAAVDDNSELYALGRGYRPFNSSTPENLEEVIVQDLKDSKAVEDPMNPEAIEVLRYKGQVRTEGVQDAEKGVSDKELNVNVDGQEKFTHVMETSFFFFFFFLFTRFLRKKGGNDAL